MKSSNKYFLKGLELSEKGSYSAAVDCFTKALETEENPEIYYERALACFHLKDNNSALSDMNKAQELDPDNPYRYSSRAYIRDKMGDIEGAMDDYKKAIELDPEDAIAYNNLGLLEEKAGFNEMAAQRFKAADDLAEKMDLFSGSSPVNGTKINDQNNFLSEIHQSITVEKRRSFGPGQYLREIVNVFTKRSAWLEFLRFVKKGGKI